MIYKMKEKLSIGRQWMSKVDLRFLPLLYKVDDKRKKVERNSHHIFGFSFRFPWITSLKTGFISVKMSLRAEKMTTTASESTIHSFKKSNNGKKRWIEKIRNRERGKKWGKNCHKNGNFETESVIIWTRRVSLFGFLPRIFFHHSLSLSLSSLVLQSLSISLYWAYNDIIRKMRIKKAIESIFHCNLIGFEGCLIRSLSKLPTKFDWKNTTVRPSIYIAMKLCEHSIFHLPQRFILYIFWLVLFFFLLVWRFFYVSQAEN